MAGLLFSVKPTQITIVTATGPITLLQIIAPTNQRVFVEEVLFSFNGVTAADPPVLIEALFQSTAGTTTGSVTPAKWNPSDSESIQTTANYLASGEPTAGNIIWGDYIHTQTGDRETAPSIRTPGFIIPGGSRLGFRYTSGTVTGTVKCQVVAKCEE